MKRKAAETAADWSGEIVLADVSSHLLEHVQFALNRFHFGFQVAQVLLQPGDIIIATQGDHVAVFAAAAAVAAASTGILVSGHVGFSFWQKWDKIELITKLIL
jgi:selenocysteine lyase/cysteine desulfurase